jgi:hypothetical protein
MDRGGAIHRRSLDTRETDTIVARARAGTSFAAERLGPDHVVLAFLAERRTSEGLVTEAYASVDRAPPLKLSEEGSGATFVALAPRGGELLALLIDGRVAMTPVHARSLRIEAGVLRAGEDAVIFVGGEAEAHTGGALAVSSTGDVFALVPIATQEGFGLTTVRVDDPPKTDEPSTWMLYPNGLDPSPIAATHEGPARIALVRPLEARPDAPWGIELGTFDSTGTFASYGLVPSRGRVLRVAIAADGGGGFWLAFRDAAGTWLEQRSCGSNVRLSGDGGLRSRP